MPRALFIPIIVGTTRPDSQTAKLAPAVADTLGRRGIKTRIFEPIFGNLDLPPWDQSPRSRETREFMEEMSRADGFILIFPEYNHAPPGALKNTLDHLYAQWERKPFGFVSVGGRSGGMRAQEHLLGTIRAIKGVAVPTNVAVSAGPSGIDLDTLEAPLDALVHDVAWWAQALREKRDTPAFDRTDVAAA